MAQVVATKLLHNSFISNGSLSNQIEKTKPCCFGSTSRRLANVITAKRPANLQFVPVTPQDLPKVHHSIPFLFIYFFTFFMF